MPFGHSGQGGPARPEANGLLLSTPAAVPSACPSRGHRRSPAVNHGARKTGSDLTVRRRNRDRSAARECLPSSCRVSPSSRAGLCGLGGRYAWGRASQLGSSHAGLLPVAVRTTRPGSDSAESAARPWPPPPARGGRSASGSVCCSATWSASPVDPSAWMLRTSAGCWPPTTWLQEIGAADLRLDEQEAQALLRGAGVELDAAQVADLTGRTRRLAGWLVPGRAVAAGRSARSDARRDLHRRGSVGGRLLPLRAVVSPAGGRGSVPVAHLGAGQDARRTLRRRSGDQAERANAPGAGAFEPLRGAARPAGRGYRYHHLFGQLLRNELERSDPEAVAELNRRAMAWCMANNLAEEAVRYGHAAGETATVAGLTGWPCRWIRRPWRPWSGWLVRPRRAGAVPHARPLRRLGSRVDRAPG